MGMAAKSDVQFGLLAWLLGLWTLAMPWLLPMDLHMALGILVSPPAWLACIWALKRSRRRPWRRLWWVWPSALLTLAYLPVPWLLVETIFNYRP